MNRLYVFIVMVAVCAYTSIAFGHTATVFFDAPADPTHVTDVLVTETSGDYSGAYGQRSDPGADFVKIGNIKPNTQYYFKAYRLIPDTWEKSPDSEEFPKLTGSYFEPILIELPPIPLSDVNLSITVEVK